jgi:toxin YoeB
MVMWTVKFSKQALKDAKRLGAAGIREKAEFLLNILRTNPYQNPPPYEKLVGDLKGSYSRRINSQHRLVYDVFESERAVKVARMWSHYE